jgi:hypothetical protein
MTWNVFIFTGKDYIQQIKYIIGVLGSPSQAVMDLCNSDIIKSFVNKCFDSVIFFVFHFVLLTKMTITCWKWKIKSKHSFNFFYILSYIVYHAENKLFWWDDDESWFVLDQCAFIWLHSLLNAYSQRKQSLVWTECGSTALNTPVYLPWPL